MKAYAARFALHFPNLYLLLTALESRIGTSYLPLPALLRARRKSAQ